MTRESKYRATYADTGVEVVLAAVGVFAGAVTLRKVDGMVHARGGISRATSSSTSYTTCTDAIPAGFLPVADTPAPASVFFATGAPALSYQFQATAAGAIQVRMSGDNTNGMTVNMTWPAA